MSGKYNESNQSISCSVCKQCGGCQYVDIHYEKELKKKSAYLKQLFEGICTVGEVHGMYRPAFYRNKVHAVVGLDKQKGIVTGTYAEGTHRLVPVDVCMIEDQKADSIIATLRELFASFKYVPYNEDTHRGFMRHILIRRGFSTKEMMVVLVTADNKFPSKNNFLKALLEKHPVCRISTITLQAWFLAKPIRFYMEKVILRTCCAAAASVSARNLFIKLIRHRPKSCTKRLSGWAALQKMMWSSMRTAASERLALRCLPMPKRLSA